MYKCIIPLHLLTETFHISFFGTKLGKSASGVHTMNCPQHFMVFVLHFCILKFNMAGFGMLQKNFKTGIGQVLRVVIDILNIMKFIIYNHILSSPLNLKPRVFKIIFIDTSIKY